MPVHGVVARVSWEGYRWRVLVARGLGISD
jgi:hypothetical protein